MASRLMHPLLVPFGTSEAMTITLGGFSAYAAIKNNRKTKLDTRRTHPLTVRYNLHIPRPRRSSGGIKAVSREKVNRVGEVFFVESVHGFFPPSLKARQGGMVGSLLIQARKVGYSQ